MTAKPIDDVFVPSSTWYDPETGNTWLTIPIPGDPYEGKTRMPAAVNYDSQVYVMTGWNSDAGVAYYRSNVKYAEGR